MINEFYFDGVGEDVITLSIFKLKTFEEKPKNLINLQEESMYKGESKIFEEVKEEGDMEVDTDAIPKMYILELKGSCRLTELDEY
eukprot:CAMPEP_0205829460 /NCGR_PEP_ID=MMETSP0206-20130828/38205_1 /ASSEMBLY_ACC=CAM_ASM_000279 /TAXON_ID=36767 /ORGANISM="Euplotes focardii, Strain TN1" /LENGTH=84 /DNA_ID=CAMNT_0053132197 /DNA_START=299 /DNA_END=553 /DNA_ORIENTATION=-